MSNGVILSVIVTTTRGDAYVSDAVEAVLDTAPRGTQVIVVFDGTAEELPSFDFASSVDMLVTGDRGGVGRALNLALRQVKGEYVARLDGDDLTHYGRFEAQLAVLEKDPTCMVVGTNGYVIDDRGARTSLYPRCYGADVRDVLLRRNPVIHSSIMFRSADAIGLGGYDERLLRMQDYDLLLRFALSGKITVLKSDYVSYRVHGEQSSRRPRRVACTLFLICTRRRVLARALGRGAFVQRWHDFGWFVGQVLRYSGLRRPGYAKVKKLPPAQLIEEK